MTSAALWKSLTVGATMAAFSFFGVATAQAAPPPPPVQTGSVQDCTGGGANADRCETNGSTAIRTSPRTVTEQRVYGPYVSRDRIWIVAD